jgi:hypothetical protein
VPWIQYNEDLDLSHLCRLLLPRRIRGATLHLRAAPLLSCSFLFFLGVSFQGDQEEVKLFLPPRSSFVVPPPSGSLGASSFVVTAEDDKKKVTPHMIVLDLAKSYYHSDQHSRCRTLWPLVAA